MRQYFVMGGLESAAEQRETRGIDAHRVAIGHVQQRFVHRCPCRHPVAQRGRSQFGVVGEAACGLADQPTAVFDQFQRQIPVVERDERLDARGQQRVQEAVVEPDTVRRRRARAVRLHAWP